MIRVLAAAALLSSCAALHDRTELWEIVHGQCVPNAAAGKGAAPCVAVSADDVLYKDQRGATHYLLIPTARRTGIEDPALLAPGGPNYFRDAWRARDQVSARAGAALGRAQIGMGVNAPAARSQGQLHLHLDCIAPGVAEGLHEGAIELRGVSYRVWAIESEELEGIDPFKFLAAHIDDSMGNHALAVLGAVLPGGRPGFYLLESASNGEALLDRSCAAARR